MSRGKNGNKEAKKPRKVPAAPVPAPGAGTPAAGTQGALAVGALRKKKW